MRKLNNSLLIIRKLLRENKGFLLGFLFFSSLITTVLAIWRIEFLDKITDVISNYWSARFLTYCLGDVVFLGVIFGLSFLIGSSKDSLLFPLRRHDIEKIQGFTFIPFPSDVDEEVRNRLSIFEHYHCRFLVFFSETKLKLVDWIRIEKRIVFIAFVLMITKDYFSTDMTVMSFAIDMFLIFLVIFLGLIIGSNISESKFICDWPNTGNLVQIIDKYLFYRINYKCVFVCPLQSLAKFSIKEAEEFYTTSIKLNQELTKEG